MELRSSGCLVHSELLRQHPHALPATHPSTRSTYAQFSSIDPRKSLPPRIAMMMTTGALSEGIDPAAHAQATVEAHFCADGIHVDMNHLKKGEVK